MKALRDGRKNRVCYKDVIEKATEAFGYNRDRALQWYMSKSPKLDNKSPFELCREGKTASLIKTLNKVLLIQ